MAESGDWLVPRYQGEPFFDKPALAYWAMAASFRLLGAEPFAARLVSVLAALGVVAATVSLGRRLFDGRTALAAGVCLSTTLAFLSFGRIAMSDMLLSFFTDARRRPRRAGLGRGPAALHLPALGACLGLGFLAKGPIALVVGGPPSWPGDRPPPRADRLRRFGRGRRARLRRDRARLVRRPPTRASAPGPWSTSSCARTCRASPTRPSPSASPSGST